MLLARQQPLRHILGNSCFKILKIHVSRSTFCLRFRQVFFFLFFFCCFFLKLENYFMSIILVDHSVRTLNILVFSIFFTLRFHITFGFIKSSRTSNDKFKFRIIDLRDTFFFFSSTKAEIPVFSVLWKKQFFENCAFLVEPHFFKDCLSFSSVYYLYYAKDDIRNTFILSSIIKLF